jgi:hypothetical protein
MEHSKDRMQEKVQEIKGSVEVSNIASIDSLMKRGQLALEESNWTNAHDVFNKVLDIDPEYVPAYIGNLCADVKVKNEEALGDGRKPLSDCFSFQKAVQFTNAEHQAKLKEYDAKVRARIAEQNAEQKEFLAQNRKIVDKYQKCIAAYNYSTVGLKSDGTVVAVRKSDLLYSYDLEGKRDIIAITAGGKGILGLKSNGTVVTEGYGGSKYSEYEKWRDIVAIAGSSSHIVGLKSDGTVVAVGDNELGQCNTGGWREIVAIAAGGSHTIGLKSDGTVIGVGKREVIGCLEDGNWRDIIAIAAGVDRGNEYILAINISGRVFGYDYNRYNATNNQKIANWKGIAAIAIGTSHVTGLKIDGTVVELRTDGLVNGDPNKWQNIGPVPEAEIVKSRLRLEEEERKKQQAEIWRQQGLCIYCGGEIGGIFKKKCKSCGEEN